MSRTGLDEPASEALGLLIAQARADGSAIIVSEHDGERVPSADQVLVLAAGSLAVVPTEAPVLADGRVLVRLVRTANTRGEDEALVGEAASIVAATGAELTLEVRRASVDRLLRQALDNAWQVRDVREQP